MPRDGKRLTVSRERRTRCELSKLRMYATWSSLKTSSGWLSAAKEFKGSKAVPTVTNSGTEIGGAVSIGPRRLPTMINRDRYCGVP